MYSLLDFVQSICSELEANSEFENISFVKKYPGVLKSAPLTEAVVSVGIAKFEVDADQIGGADEKTATVQLEFLVCVPFFADSLECPRIMQKLFEHFLFESSLNVKKCECKDITAKRDTGAYEQKGTVEIETKISRAVN